LSQVSGNTSLCDYHHVSGYLFPQSISFWTTIKTTEGPHPHQGLACFDESGLLFWSATTFPGYISMYTCVHLDVSLWWGIHGLCILWNSFDLRCESVTFLVIHLHYTMLYYVSCNLLLCDTYIMTGSLQQLFHFKVKVLQNKWSNLRQIVNVRTYS